MKTFAEKHWGDCSKAVAYQLNFVQMCNSYPTDCYNDYYELCPECGSDMRQNRDYEYPKSSFSKKDYYQLDTYDMCVSEKLKKDMFAFGIAEDNFRPVYTRKHDVVLGYQIAPKNVLPSIADYNAEEQIFHCKKCGIRKFEIAKAYDDAYFASYNRLGTPVYISNEVYEALQDINCCYEERCNVIISLDLYNYLIEKYPRLECRPVFIGNIKDDPEFRKHLNR